MATKEGEITSPGRATGGFMKEMIDMLLSRKVPLLSFPQLHTFYSAAPIKDVEVPLLILFFTTVHLKDQQVA